MRLLLLALLLCLVGVPVGAQPVVCEAPCALPVGPLAVEMDMVPGVVLYELLMDGAVLSAPVTIANNVVTFTVPQGVPAGVHVFQVRTVGGSTAGQTLTVCGANVWAANYYANTTLTGTPITAGCESQIAHAWGVGGPTGLPADKFSARYLGMFTFAGTTTVLPQSPAAYLFTARTDDGMRAWVDANPVLDSWKNQGATTYTVQRSLVGGHAVRVETYEDGGDATAVFGWQLAPVQPPPPPAGTCTSDPLTFTVSTWPSQPTGSRLLFYASNKPVTVVLNVTKTPFTATATDTRGCTVTRSKP